MRRRIDILSRNLLLAVVATFASFPLVYLTPNDSVQAIGSILCIWGSTSCIIISAEDKQPLIDTRHTLSVIIIALVVFMAVISLSVELLTRLW